MKKFNYLFLVALIFLGSCSNIKFKKIKNIDVKDPFYTLTFSPKNNFFAISDYYKYTFIFDIKNDKITEIQRISHDDQIINEIVFSQDGKYMAYFSENDSDYINVFHREAHKYKLIKVINITSLIQKKLFFSPDNRFLAAYYGSYLDFFSVDNDFTLLKHIELGYSTNSIAFSPDWKFMAKGVTADASDSMIIYSVSNLKFLKIKELMCPTEYISKIKFSPNNKFIAVIGERFLGLYSFRKSNCSLIDSKKLTDPETISFSPNNNLLAVGYNGYAKVYKIKNNKLKSVKRFHEERTVGNVHRTHYVTYNVKLDDVAFSSDGQYLVIGGRKGFYAYKILVK